MSAVPEATPVTTPDPDPAVAVLVLLLLQVPPGDPSLSVIVDPTHTTVGPVMFTGSGFTVTPVNVLQPVGNV